MAIINKGTAFSNGEQLSASKLNALIDEATFGTDSVDNSSTLVNANGAITVRDSGITAAKLATGAVTTAKILDANVTFAKLTDVIDDDTMDTATDTTLATSGSIKAYVTAMRPKFVALTGGTTALTQTNPSNGSTAVYNIADFTSGDSDFATTKITGLIVEGEVACRTNTNLIIASLPDGSTTQICRTIDTGNNGVSDAATAFIPINSDTTSFTLTYTVGNTFFSTHCRSTIRGAIIQPGL